MAITFNSVDLSGESRATATDQLDSQMRQEVEVVRYSDEEAPDLVAGDNLVYEFSWTTERVHASVADAKTFWATHATSLTGNHAASVHGATFAQAAMTRVAVRLRGVSSTTSYTMLCSTRAT